MGSRRGSAQWWSGLGFAAALLGGLAAPSIALAGTDPLRVLDQPVLRWAGLLLAVAGVAGTVAAQLAMGEAWRIGVDPGERTALVTTGVFRLTRNPIFTTMLLTAAGLALMVGNVLAVLAFVALLTAVQVQVRVVEEPYLRRVHDGAYAGYAAVVGRFVPGMGRLPKAGTQ